jgi:RAB protein geranylgeranyltransferase component A
VWAERYGGLEVRDRLRDAARAGEGIRQAAMNDSEARVHLERHLETMLSTIEYDKNPYACARSGSSSMARRNSRCASRLSFAV